VVSSQSGKFYTRNAHLDCHRRFGKSWHLRSHCTTFDTLHKAAKIKQAFGTAAPYDKKVTDILLSRALTTMEHLS